MKYTALILTILMASCGVKAKHEITGKTEHKLEVEIGWCREFEDPDEKIRCLEAMVALFESECKAPEAAP